MTRTRIAQPGYTNAEDAVDVNQQPDIDLNPDTKGQPTVELAPALTPRDIETAAFFEQELIVMVHQPADGQEILTLNYNGADAVVHLGRENRLKRKFVGQLASMRKTDFTQPNREAMNVERGNRLVPRTMMLYPFSVQRDPHPHGVEWLRRELGNQNSIAGGLR